MMPDVAINHLYSDFFILYTYVNAAKNHLYVGYEGNYSGSCLPSSINYSLMDEDISYDSHLSFWYPRIACPNGTTNSLYSKERAVVVGLENTSGPKYLIVGYTADIYANHYNLIYDDGGSNSPCSIDGSINRYPVVSYNYNYRGIMVGWQSDYTGPSNSFYPTSCLAVQCDQNGRYNGSGYLIVPSDNISLPNASLETSLSLSGRENGDGSDNIQYSFYSQYATDLLYKLVPYSSSSLRSIKHNENTVSVAPNPFTDDLQIHLLEPDEQVHLSIRNTMGKMLMEVSGNEAEINKRLSVFAGTLSSGVYFLCMDSAFGQITTEKLVKM